MEPPPRNLTAEKLVREETADERWNAHSQWEIRKYGFTCSNEDEWKQRFVLQDRYRPAFPPKFTPPKVNLDSEENLALRKAQENNSMN